MQDSIKEIFKDSIGLKQAILENGSLLQKTEEATRVISEAFTKGFRIYFCGNGGSAADAQHLAAEFSGPFYNRLRRALPAEALHCNTSYLTAAANDYDYASVYARLVDGIMEPGDILIGLSTSGNSANIVKAFEMAQNKHIFTIGFTGEGGGQLGPLSNILFDIPSKTTPRIQEVHMLIGHTICEMVEKNLFPDGK